MVDKMTFPDTLEEFVEQYKVIDTDGIYMSKGSELVPIFRIKQWCDHIFAMTRPEQCQDTISRQAVVKCKDCKHNPKYVWFDCPMSHLSEKQRPETAWCWKGERREDG